MLLSISPLAFLGVWLEGMATTMCFKTDASPLEGVTDHGGCSSDSGGGDGNEEVFKLQGNEVELGAAQSRSLSGWDMASIWESVNPFQEPNWDGVTLLR